MTTAKTLGQVAYEAFFKSAKGDHMVTWDRLTDEDRRNWHDAAAALRARIFEDMRDRFIAGLYRVFGDEP